MLQTLKTDDVTVHDSQAYRKMDVTSRRIRKKNASHGNEVPPQDTTRLIQRPCYRRGSQCQDPAGNRTTRRPPDHCKETQTAVVRSCLPFIRCGQNHLARHSERGKKTKQTEEEVGRQHREMDSPGAVSYTHLTLPTNLRV